MVQCCGETAGSSRRMVLSRSRPITRSVPSGNWDFRSGPLTTRSFAATSGLGLAAWLEAHAEAAILAPTVAPVEGGIAIRTDRVPIRTVAARAAVAEGADNHAATRGGKWPGFF